MIPLSVDIVEVMSVLALRALVVSGCLRERRGYIVEISLCLTEQAGDSVLQRRVCRREADFVREV
jgi:hypothetical protein